MLIFIFTQFDKAKWPIILFTYLHRHDGHKLEGNGPKDERAAMMVVSEANFDLRFEFSNLNYPGTYVHVVSNSRLGGL